RRARGRERARRRRRALPAPGRDAADPRLEEAGPVAARDGVEEGVARRRAPGGDGAAEEALEDDVHVARARERVDAADDAAPLRALEQERGLPAGRHGDPGARHVDARPETGALHRPRRRGRRREPAGRRPRPERGERRREQEPRPHTSLRNQSAERSAPSAMKPSAPAVVQAVISRLRVTLASREPRSLYTCLSALAEPALKKRPPLPCAIARSCAGAGGTALRSVKPPGIFWSTKPSGVPSDTVEIGTSSFRACSHASCGRRRPAFCAPSERSRTAAGGCGAPGLLLPTAFEATSTAVAAPSASAVPSTSAFAGRAPTIRSRS